MQFVIIFCMHAFMIFTVFSVVYIYGSIYEWVETTRYLHDLSDVFLVSCACGFAGFSNVSARIFNWKDGETASEAYGHRRHW